MIIYHYCGSLVSVVVLIAVLSFLGLLQQQLFSSATFIRSFHNHDCNNNNNIVHPNFVVLQSSQLLSSSKEEENELSSRSSTTTTTTTITTSRPRIQQQHNSPERTMPILKFQISKSK
jgi:hypothetical protein